MPSRCRGNKSSVRKLVMGNLLRECPWYGCTQNALWPTNQKEGSTPRCDSLLQSSEFREPSTPVDCCDSSVQLRVYYKTGLVGNFHWRQHTSTACTSFWSATETVQDLLCIAGYVLLVVHRSIHSGLRKQDE